MLKSKCSHCRSDIQGILPKCSNCGKRTLTTLGILLIVIGGVTILHILGTVSDDIENKLDKKEAPLYEVIGTKSHIEHGQKNVTIILISPDIVNEKGMKSLGNVLKEDFKYDNMAFIYIYDKKDAALLRKSVLDETSSDEDDEYHDRHCVGIYMKNLRANLNKFMIFYNGISGSNSEMIDF